VFSWRVKNDGIAVSNHCKVNVKAYITLIVFDKFVAIPSSY